MSTPEVEKMMAARDQGSQEIGEFLDHLLNEQGFVIAKWGARQEEVECIGLSRDGRPNGMFDGSNCMDGEIRRHRVLVDGKTHMLNDPCPRCEGTGRITISSGEEGFIPDRRSVQQLLADYFEVDLDALERERRAVLDQLREANA